MIDVVGVVISTSLCYTAAISAYATPLVSVPYNSWCELLNYSVDCESILYSEDFISNFTMKGVQWGNASGKELSHAVLDRDLIPLTDSTPTFYRLPGRSGANLDLIFMFSSLAHFSSVFVPGDTFPLITLRPLAIWMWTPTMVALPTTGSIFVGELRVVFLSWLFLWSHFIACQSLVSSAFYLNLALPWRVEKSRLTNTSAYAGFFFRAVHENLGPVAERLRSAFCITEINLRYGLLQQEGTSVKSAELQAFRLSTNSDTLSALDCMDRFFQICKAL